MLGILAVIVLLIANAFFVAAEFSLVSADRDRINSKKGYRARITSKLIKRLTFHLTGSQLGITAVALLLGFIAEMSIGELLESPVENVFGEGSAKGISIALALAIATILHMVVGEQIPKIFALSRSQGTALALAPIVRIYSLIVYPVVLACNGLANSILRAMGVEPKEELLNVRNRGDLEEMFRSSGEEGEIDKTDVGLLTRSLYFGEKESIDVVVPRMEVETIELDENISELVKKSLETGYSRFPVTGGDLDDVRGVIHIKSAHKVRREEWENISVADFMVDVLAVPENLPLADLLKDMGSKRSPMAVVIDEHGGTTGIVTAEDILEQIVGEISDEHDTDPGESVESIGGGDFVFPGSTQIEDLKQSCGFSAPPGPYETLAGFIFFKLQRMPKNKELLNYKGWWFEVAEMDGHRIASIKVSQPRDYIEREQAL